MLSMPPATTTSFEPATMTSCASIVAFIAEPHILDSVVQLTEIGSPAFSAACRAGAWPCPAIRQLPKSSSCTSPGAMPGALHRGLDRHGAQVARGQRREIALEAAHRRARGAHDHDRIILHRQVPLFIPFPDLRRGRATSSPPQFGQRPCMASAHFAQNVHS